MIKALRILSRVALIGAALFLFVVWYTDRAGVPLQSQTSIEGEIDYIIVEKKNRKMTLFQDGRPVRVYEIALGFSPSGDKVREGDGRTPEGIYKIDRRNPNSSFHLSLGINYPLPEDLKRAREGGYSAGGDIFIHGQPNLLPDNRKYSGDWTAGCIAVTNHEIREIWDVTPIGTTIEIRT